MIRYFQLCTVGQSRPSTAQRAAALAGLMSLLGGCATLGSESIVVGRTPVNEAVATTARQQTLMNIVRVYHNESPLILDIVEADEAVSLGASGTGGVTAIGAIPGAMGRAGSASATVSAADAITNRYVPLQGQALISQLSSQITVETLNALYDSDWPIQSIIEFAIDRITPDNDDFDLAEDLITQLDSNLAIALATAKSGFSTESSSAMSIAKLNSVTISAQPPAAGGGDTLNLYFGPKPKSRHSQKNAVISHNAWTRLFSLYQGTQPDQKGKDRTESLSTPNLIELRNSPRTHLNELTTSKFQGAILGPVMRTRTAIGILKYIVSQPDVAFVSEAEYEFITHLPWNQSDYHRRCPTSDSYILSSKSPKGRQDDDKEVLYHYPDMKKVNDDDDRIYDFLSNISLADNQLGKYFDQGSFACNFTYGALTKIKYNADFATDLGMLKRFILIVKSSSAPTSSFTSWYNDGMYYSIMPDDLISQRNLMLVSQFLTIQATSTPSPSLTTVSASGR